MEIEIDSSLSPDCINLYGNPIEKPPIEVIRQGNKAILNYWSDKQYRNMIDVLIELMKSFRLVYEIGDSGNLVAPQMLPQDTPDYDWDSTTDFGGNLMQFCYDCLISAFTWLSF